MTPAAHEKLTRWNNELKPTFLEQSGNVRLCRNVSYAFSLIAAVGAYVSGSRLRGTPAFTLTVLGLTAGTAVIAAAVGRHFGRQTTFEKDPQWKLEQYQIAEKAIFDSTNFVMKMGLTEARAQYGSAIEVEDVKRWLEQDLFYRLAFIDLPKFHGTDLTTHYLFTEKARDTLLSRFETDVKQEFCTQSAAELSNAWDNILTAHGVEESKRKTLYSYPSFREAISKNNYSILHQRGNLNDVWATLEVSQQREIKAAFIAYANTQLIPITTLLNDYRDALEKFELIIPVPQQNLYDLASVQQHRFTDTQDRIWSPEGIELLKSIFNKAVSSSWNYDDLRTLTGGFRNLDLLDQAENQKLRTLFLNLPYNIMRDYALDMHSLNISEDDRNQRLNADFRQNPVAAWNKHGLQPFDDEIIIADSISSAREKLVASLQNSSSAGIEQHRPLVKALHAEHDIAELQQTKWFEKNIFSLGEAEALAFLEFFNSLTLGDERRTAWLSKALQDAEHHSFQKLWSEHRAFFKAGLLQTSQFHDKFHTEIHGKSFVEIVKCFGLEWLDAQLGLTSPEDHAVRRAVGLYLISFMKLPVNLAQPNDNLTALEKHGFFDYPLKQLITSASADILEANQQLRQDIQRFKDAFNQTMQLVEEQCKESSRQAQKKWDTAQLYVNSLAQNVQKANEVERLSRLLSEATSSQPELDQAEKTALAEFKEASLKKPQGDEDKLKKTLREHRQGIAAQEKQKNLETELELLNEKLPAVQSAANESRDKAATHTTAFATLSLAYHGRTEQERQLNELTSQISQTEEALKDATAKAQSTQSAIKSKEEIAQIQTQLKHFDAYNQDCNQKNRLHNQAQAALAKCEKDIQSYRQSIHNLSQQLGLDSLVTQRQKLATAECDAIMAKTQYETAFYEAQLTREQTQAKAHQLQDIATKEAQNQYEALRQRKQDEVNSSIQRTYQLA